MAESDTENTDTAGEETLSPEARRTAQARRREVIRLQAMEPVKEQIDLQLRESGLAH